MSAVVFDAVSVVFGANPTQALPLMDANRTRAEIEAETGQILGVHDCSLRVEEGEILVLMGLSGSGKSTLLRTVNALNPVTRGDVSVRGEAGMVSVTQADQRTLRGLRTAQISMVFQQFGLLPWRSVRDNVGLGLELAGMTRSARRAKVDAQLALVGLADWSERSVGELSGGMQQRVGLARAFATEAPILLMDEPFSALDPLIRNRLQDELLLLQAELQRTIVFVSHDLDEAFKIGNRIAIMEGGRIVQCGTPREIFSAPASDYVADFVADMNPLTVLKARDAIEPVTTPATTSIDAGQSIRDAMELIRATEHPIAVEEEGTVIGQLSRASVLTKLLNPRS
ncbi:MAG: choline ABC transporter ATP-binding protein [Pseudomonadota bacterium]